MLQPLRCVNVTDDAGNPTGGSVHGTGLDVHWQDGPLGRGEERRAPNGAFVEDLIEAARQRLQFYEDATGKRFSCRENKSALWHLESALLWLARRTQSREARHVEGTHEP